MRIQRAYSLFQCAWIIQPGELTIDSFDNQRCSERSPMQLTECGHCGKHFCLMSHWGKHLDSLTPDDAPTIGGDNIK